MFTRRFMPPEYLSTRSFCLSVRPISSSTSSTRLLERSPAHPVHPAPEQEILPAAQVFVQGDVLRDHPDERLDLLRFPRHREPGHPRFSTVGLEQAGEDGDGGGLAGSVGAQEAEYLALLDLERDPVDGDRALGRIELLAEFFHHDRVHCAPFPLQPVRVAILYPNRWNADSGNFGVGRPTDP